MPAILQNILKFNILAGSGLVITIVLFLLMQGLIHQDFVKPDTGNSVTIADITLPEIEIEVIRKTPQPEPLELVELPPMKHIPAPVPGQPFGGGVRFEPPSGLAIDPRESGLFNLDSNAVPLVQTQPAYPNRAAQKGIEGYVVVEFDVDEQGSVINPRILYAEPQGYFEQASLRALERYRYQPKVVNGKEVKMLGIQQKFTFTLED